MNEQYKDARWQKKRLEAFEHYNWKCQKCGSVGEGEFLHVHHLRYGKGKVWDAGLDDLSVLCEPCHTQITGLKRNIAAILHNPHVFAAFCDFYKLAEIQFWLGGFDDEANYEPFEATAKCARVMVVIEANQARMSVRFSKLKDDLKEKFPEVAGALMPDDQNANDDE